MIGGAVLVVKVVACLANCLPVLELALVVVIGIVAELVVEQAVGMGVRFATHITAQVAQAL
jgi:hypothetical protein